MQRFTILVFAATIASANLAVCQGAYAAEGGYGYGYADGYYDNFYGPVWDGYWGPHDVFYYRKTKDNDWLADQNHRFRREASSGFVAFHLPAARPWDY